MKTPEQIAGEIVAGRVDGMEFPAMRDDVAAAIAAERVNADALAEALRKTTATVAALYQWLEQVEAAGGATNLSGIAKCHAMLTSMRKNADRTEKLVMAPARAALAAYDRDA